MISTPLALVTIHTPCALIIVHKPKRQFPTIGPLTLFFARRHGVHADLLLLIVVGCAFLKLSESLLLLFILRVGPMVTKVRFLEASRTCVHIYHSRNFLPIPQAETRNFSFSYRNNDDTSML